MGLFQRNIHESIKRENDTNTLIRLNPAEDFNTNSVITVAPNEQVIFIKNGEFYGTLSSGRHEVKTENIPVFNRIRDFLSGGRSAFTCQVYHVQLNEQLVKWGTSMPIEIQDYHLGDGIPTKLRGAANIKVCFNINEDDDACKKTFMRLMGDKSEYTVNDLSTFFHAEISTEISSLIARKLEDRSKTDSINGISGDLKNFAAELKPEFDILFAQYGLECRSFSFVGLSIDDDEIRRKYIDRLSAAKHTGSYDKAMQQELLKDISTNPGAGGIAAAGAGIGMGAAAGNAFAQMATTAFSSPQIPQQPQQQLFGGQNRFGTEGAAVQQPQQPSLQDPMVVLQKMKQLLDAGLITQQIYDAKVAEVLSRL